MYGVPKEDKRIKACTLRNSRPGGGNRLNTLEENLTTWAGVDFAERAERITRAERGEL